MRAISKITALGVAVFFAFPILSFSQTRLEGERTQKDFAFQLCKAMDIEAPADDYVTELESRGIFPEGGWQPEKAISNKEMASILAKAMGLAKGSEPLMNLEAGRSKATILEWAGQVWIRRGPTAAWTAPEKGMRLSLTDAIRTGEMSWLDLRIGVVGLIKISENSEIELAELSSNPDGSQNIAIHLAAGELIVDARTAPKGSDVKVHTPTTVAAVRGTIYKIKVTGESTELLNAA